MKKFRALLTLFLFIPYAFHAQVINKYPLSPRVTGYRIEANLDTAARTVSGTMDAFWVNKSNDIVPDVQLHLYLNAFRDHGSTFYRESGDLSASDDEDPGWIGINSISTRGTDLRSKMQFISPDDGNPEDRTVLKIDLPEPAHPGDTVFLKITFESKLPSLDHRTGYNDDFYFAGQWFPKFGVYEPPGMRYAVKGAWNCHQFHAHSEFYSDHSVYDVKLTVPEHYVTGSCGLLLGTTSEGGFKTLTYRAEDIVDFAWTAWPGYAEFTDTWKDVKITLLIPAGRKEQVGRQFNAVKNGLEYFTENIGPYPWPYLTFVDPPAKGFGAGGMEYTTLFTSLSYYKVPRFFHFPEMVTIHELGHTFFMGILASNEFEEPWLDEGVTTFWEERAVDHYYGRYSGFVDLPFFKVSDMSLSRISYLMSGSRQVVSSKEYSWNYPHDTYEMMSYNKPAMCLYTLMGIIGEETMNEVFREYYRRWSFRHPSGKDFFDVVNDVVSRIHGKKFGPDMNWYFNQTIYGTGLCDYRVAGFENQGVNGNSPADTIFNAVVQLERPGEIMLPVEVAVRFKDGKKIIERWDGKSRYKDFTYYSVPKVTSVIVDPDYEITIDINRTNNSKTSEPDTIPLRRITGMLISFMQFFINFISL